jgi:hypothetical protein
MKAQAAEVFLQTQIIHYFLTIHSISIVGRNHISSSSFMFIKNVISMLSLMLKSDLGHISVWLRVMGRNTTIYF